jgi:hypothetical protein
MFAGNGRHGRDISWVSCNALHEGYATVWRAGKNIRIAATTYWCSSHGGYTGVKCPTYDSRDRRVGLIPVEFFCRQRKEADRHDADGGR